MRASDAKSMLLVASSRTMIAARRSSARARAISWRWPCEKLAPPAETVLSSVTVTRPSPSASVSMPDSDVSEDGATSALSLIDGARDVTRDVRCDPFVLSLVMPTRLSTSKHSASECSSVSPGQPCIYGSQSRLLKGSRFSRSVPEKSVALSNMHERLPSGKDRAQLTPEE
jgi:hypothetical protein